jgi:dGTPase
LIKREDIEAKEISFLSEYAAKSRYSKGRKDFEEKCRFRTDFQRDRDRIIHSKAFRRLMHKTQVFLSPEGDHFRTRLTHTLEVAQISRTIARALNLNEDLAEAIAMGHDLGHTPFGHNGETYLNEIHKNGFKHNEQSLRVVDFLEKRSDNVGMNLTEEVRDGILNHTGAHWPFTLEGRIVRFSDRIAYINHDIDDAIRGGVLKEEDIPEECLQSIGKSHRERINNLIVDLVENSMHKNDITMSEERLYFQNKLRDFMFENVYHSEIIKQTDNMIKIRKMMEILYDYYLKNTEQLPIEYRDMIDRWGKEEIVKDHIAGMTDRYAINLFKEVFVPSSWK